MFLSLSSFAQNDEGKSFGERLYFGGSFGFSFGDYTYIDVSPLIGYGITERFSAGVGGTYQYISNYGAKDSNYGGRVFSRYGIFKNVFAHVEYESLNGTPLNIDNIALLQRTWIDAFFIGAGYSTHLGAQQGFQAYLLYNLLHDEQKTHYREPLVIRFSVTF